MNFCRALCYDFDSLVLTTVFLAGIAAVRSLHLGTVQVFSLADSFRRHHPPTQAFHERGPAAVEAAPGSAFMAAGRRSRKHQQVSNMGSTPLGVSHTHKADNHGVALSRLRRRYSSQ